MDPAAPSLPESWEQSLIRQTSADLQQHPDAAAARAYLELRGVSLEEAALHSVGVMSPVKTGTAPFITWSSRHWVPWGGLVFPLFDALGGVTGIEVRRLPEEVQPGRNPYSDFQFNRMLGQPLAFGIPQALPRIWETHRVTVVEGVFDYFAVRNAGSTTVVANLTANIAASMRKFLGRYASTVVALLDMDPAGRRAVQRLIEMGIEENFSVIAPSYPGKDPGTLLSDRRLDRIRNLIARYEC